MRELWPHQESALQRLRESFLSGKRRPLVSSPTGSGKTLLAAALVHSARQKGNRVMFCVPALELVDQTINAFWDEGIKEIGVMQAQHDMTDCTQPVQIASVQTLARRAKPNVDVVMIDEAHRVFESVTDWLASPGMADIPVIGLSATPWTKGLGKIYDDLIIVATTEDLIAKGFLSPFKVYAAAHPDLTGVRTIAGDYHEGDLSKAMDRPELTADVVKTWKAIGENRSTLVFAVDRAHAARLQKDFEAAGIRTGYIDAYTPGDERGAIRAAFQSGETRVVCNVNVLTMGVDWDVRCIVLARPTKSEMLFVQMIGRGLRTAEGKDFCKILDHSDSHLRLGFVTDINHTCVARDTLVLTDRGEVKIQEVTLDDCVWDGVNFVRHGGAVCKGIQRVIEYDGLIATPDHEVMTNEGWTPLSTAIDRRKRIVKSGIRGYPLRVFDDCVTHDNGEVEQASRRGSVRPLRAHLHGAFVEYQTAPEYESLPEVQRAFAYHSSSMALSEMCEPPNSVQQSEGDAIQGLRGKGDRVQILESEFCSNLDSEKHWSSDGSDVAIRSHRQQRTLRSWESSLGDALGSNEQYAAQSWRSQSIPGIPSELPGNKICGQHAASAHFNELDRRDDKKTLGTEPSDYSEVWDIHNAGPLQRFTANGRLVHNCLNDGAIVSSENKPPVELPKECPKCHFLKPAKATQCPACGFKPERQSEVRSGDGELVEIAAHASKVDKQAWFSMLLMVAEQRGYKAGWAANQYRAKFGVWPRGLEEVAVRPTVEVWGWVKSRQIAWAKSKHNPANQAAP